jgi:hypothetical protein
MGLGSAPKTLAVKNLIKYEKPHILLIRKTNMKVEDAIKIGKSIS